jgi:hypothetical protein
MQRHEYLIGKSGGYIVKIGPGYFREEKQSKDDPRRRMGDLVKKILSGKLVKWQKKK